MSLVEQNKYDDAFPTCAKTYSTLRIFSDAFAPDEITQVLKIEPTKTFCKGGSHSKGRLKRKANGWFYCTENASTSKDTRRHIDLILSVLDGKREAIEKIQAKGCKIDIDSYWVSSNGQGGPWLMPQQMLKLGTFGIDVHWDVYFTQKHNSGSASTVNKGDVSDEENS